jgi:hypothetical protein
MKRFLGWLGLRFFDRADGGAVALQPVVPVREPGEDVRVYRDRLAQEVVRRGQKPYDIESLHGDCDEQTDAQIKDYQNWLTTH